MTDELQATYVAVVIGQTISMCKGRKSRLSTQIFIDYGLDQPTPQEQYPQLYIDQFGIGSAPESYI